MQRILTTKWGESGNVEDHLMIWPCYDRNIEKGENDTHGCMNAAYNRGVTLLAFSIAILLLLHLTLASS